MNCELSVNAPGAPPAGQGLVSIVAHPLSFFIGINTEKLEGFIGEVLIKDFNGFGLALSLNEESFSLKKAIGDFKEKIIHGAPP